MKIFLISSIFFQPFRNISMLLSMDYVYGKLSSWPAKCFLSYFLHLEVENGPLYVDRSVLSLSGGIQWNKPYFASVFGSDKTLWAWDNSSFQSIHLRGKIIQSYCQFFKNIPQHFLKNFLHSLGLIFVIIDLSRVWRPWAGEIGDRRWMDRWM